MIISEGRIQDAEAGSATFHPLDPAYGRGDRGGVADSEGGTRPGAESAVRDDCAEGAGQGGRARLWAGRRRGEAGRLWRCWTTTRRLLTRRSCRWTRGRFLDWKRVEGVQPRIMLDEFSGVRGGGQGGSGVPQGLAQAGNHRPGPGDGGAVVGGVLRVCGGGGTSAGADTQLRALQPDGQRVRAADRGAERAGGSQQDGGDAGRRLRRYPDGAGGRQLRRGVRGRVPAGT